MKLGLFAALALLTPSVASAYLVVVPDSTSSTHVDLAITYAEGQLRGLVNSDAFGQSSVDTTLLYDGPLDTTSIARPASATWDFLGVGPGEELYYWPQSQINQRLYLGFASDHGLVPSGTFASYFEADPRVAGTARWLKISLVEVVFDPAPGETRPGYFSLWQTGAIDTTVWMSSFQNGIDASDATWLIEGGHSHYNWGFSARGYYRITFQFSGTLAGSNQLITSAPITFHFGVENQPAALVIPEPGSFAGLLAATGLLLGFRRPSLTSRGPAIQPKLQ